MLNASKDQSARDGNKANHYFASQVSLGIRELSRLMNVSQGAKFHIAKVCMVDGSIIKVGVPGKAVSLETNRRSVHIL